MSSSSESRSIGERMTTARGVADAALGAGGHRTTGEWMSQTGHRTVREWKAQENHRTPGEWTRGVPSGQGTGECSII